MIGLRAAPAQRQDPACRVAFGSPYRVQERRYGSSRSRFVGMYRSTRKGDRKSTRLNFSHQIISYAVFCLKKKKECDYFSL